MDKYIFRSFVKADIPKMHLVFLDAFADYTLPFNLSYQQFLEKFIHKLNIDLSLSVGAFDDDLMGFIFTGVNTYYGKKTAYNGGTGVMPAYRGQGLTMKMYDHLWPLFEKEGIKQAVLEVITTNKKAIKAYQHCGFAIHKLYHCFRLNVEALADQPVKDSLSITKIANANWARYTTFLDCPPSYLDSISVLSHNIVHEHVAEAKMDNMVVGYIIFQPNAARISQIAVRKEYRGQGIGRALLRYALQHISTKVITLLNIDHQEKETIQVLQRLGFQNSVDQYEMIKLL